MVDNWPLQTPNQKEEYFFKNLGVVLNNYLSKYEHIIFLGDFNLTTSNKYIADFMTLFNLESLINTPTCFHSEKPRCIDLIITNKKGLLKNSKTFEVGISDHHNLILTAMRSQYIQGNPKIKFYRDYKSFNFESFHNELNELLKSEKDINYSLLENIFLQVLNVHAPVKKKIQRFNNNPFMTKQLRKGIMHRSRLKNVFNKNRTPKNWDSYKKQRNFCVNLLRKTKKEYLENINVKDINDNKKFWKTIKPFVSNKGLNTNKSMIIEKNNLISEESILANTMNQYFTSITKQLNLKASPQLREGEGDILHKQIETFMSNKLSNKFSGFCKIYNTQYCLTYMLEKWKNTLGKGKHVGAVFMDLSKAFDTINHDLLIAKLEAHGFLNNALLFMLSYLKNRSERVSISFSTWEKIIAGARQGSILGPLLFNIFLNDIFYFENRSFLSNYADDNVLYAFGSNLDEVKQNLSEDLLKLSEWFYENSMILNLEKCH